MTVRAKILSGMISVLVFGLVLGISGLASISSLTAMSDEQREIQTAGNSVTTVLNAHYTWRQSLTEAALGMTAFTGSLDPVTCALGKWKASDAQNVTDAEILSLLKSLDEPHNYIHNEAGTVATLIAAGDQTEAARVLLNDILPRANEAISVLETIEKRYITMLDAKATEVVNFGNTMNTVMLILLAVALVVCVILGLKITASIMKPIRQITQCASTIAAGDLSVDVSYNSKDEIGQLANAFREMLSGTKAQVAAAEHIANGDLTISVTPRSDKDSMNIAFQAMLKKLNEMFKSIQSSTTQVSSGSKQIADGAQALAQGATQQAAAIQQLTSSVADIESKTKANAGMAEKAAILSETIKSGADKGNRQMNEMMNAVKEISQASQSIGKVIKVIDDIAFQTNILALNAAVEAARAGQHGKGFAVVAEEVRNLAAKSAEAAKDTGGLIANSIEKAELGAKIADETAASLSEIVAGINESSQLVAEIARSSEEQSCGISQINKGIDQVAHVVQQNSAAAEESAAASEEMSSQANLLEDLISQFRVSNSAGAGRHLSAPPLIQLPAIQTNAIESASDDFGKY